MSNELLLLGLLRSHQMHGYQLSEFLTRNLSTCTDLKKPTAYFLLGKMAEQGWIAEEQTQEGNRPPRRVYHLTTLGEANFQRLLRENLAAFEPVTMRGDAGLAFLDFLPPGEAAELLMVRRGGLAQALEQARSAPHHAGSLGLVLEHQVLHLQAELAWVEQVIAGLQREASTTQNK